MPKLWLLCQRWTSSQELSDGASLCAAKCVYCPHGMLLPILTPNPQLEMLTQREQLMEDIDSIIESYQSDENFDINDCDDRDDLIRVLCDSVCRNFPS